MPRRTKISRNVEFYQQLRGSAPVCTAAGVAAGERAVGGSRTAVSARNSTAHYGCSRGTSLLGKPAQELITSLQGCHPDLEED